MKVNGKKVAPALWLTAWMLGGGVWTSCSKEDVNPEQEAGPATAYITRVLEYRPAPGQFVNTMPEYEDGDTEETMIKKVLEAIGNNERGLITLGGYGGYVTVGFDHTIENKPGVCDFRVLGNAFAAARPASRGGDGSCEPGIVYVAYDRNKNGKPDADEWYEIAGSAHKGAEAWYDELKQAGNDVTLYRDYQITYHKPENDPDKFTKPVTDYIRWEANQGEVKEGFRTKNIYHKQPYYPQWIQEDKLTFTGTCLPQNGVNKRTETSSSSDYYILYQFAYGYADNAPNGTDGCSIDIDWAVDKDGKPASLPGVDFIRIQTGVNQENGWLGECSTEVMGVEDLHLLNEKVTVNH